MRVKVLDTGLEWADKWLVERTSTQGFIIHHTGNPTDDDPSAQEIHVLHQNLGWAGCGYHFIIRKDGTVERGRPENFIGAHAEGSNSNTIGICVTGNFEIASPTAAQLDALIKLLADLAESFCVFINEDTVQGHRDVNPTACPGENFYWMIKDIRYEVNLLLQDID